MTSKDDDTLPLPGLSEDLSVDATVDEDFIPTSQPHSSGSPKMSKDSENSFNRSTEELKCSISDSRIDDTLPPEAVMNHTEMDKNKSADFIPDTETKKTKMRYGNEEVSCKKRLPVFGAEDIFKGQSNPLWESEAAQIPESPALEMPNLSILNDTPTEGTPPSGKPETRVEESITEIIVNDSAETVDFYTVPLKKQKNSDSERAVEVFEISYSCSSSSEGKCEETQVFDNSSVLLLDPQGADCSGVEKNEKVSGVTSEKLYLQETVEMEEETKIKGKTNGFACDAYAPAEAFGATDSIENAVDVFAKNVFPKQEVQQNSTYQELHSASLATRKLEMKLTVSCFVTFNTKTNKVLQKIILNVNETPKAKPKPVCLEAASDNASDKSKRYSTSSSGSVYSDKMGPFALPKRVSVISDQTDSSEDEISLMRIKEKRALERVPWSNEYLLPLKMDDLIHLSIENQELLKRPSIVSPRKVKSKNCNGVNHLEEILESSTSEQTSECNLESGERESSRAHLREMSNSEETVGKETHESPEAVIPEEEKTPNESVQNESNIKAVSQEGGDKSEEPSPKAVADEEETGTKEKSDEVMKKAEEEAAESSSVSLCDGVAVFARWALDKRYYSGVLCGSVKNERWEVQFDDGTRKNVREDFIMPVAWLKAGALVFAMTDEKYESGQVVDVRRREEVEYVVELDSGKREIRVKMSDLCLTDVMAGIVREKYKPLVETPRAKADIDFDNVLSGKRCREQRTPLRPPPATVAGSSGAKKKSSSKAKKDNSNSMKSIKETPEGDTGKKRGGLKTENGHLVEDKVISADSPSGTEAGETPHRKTVKDPRKKAKPRSLSYEAEENRTGGKKKKWNSWLAPDGTPIPGPSGLQTKMKQKTKAAETSDSEAEAAPAASKSYTTRSKAGESTEKSRRKRKLDESVEGSAQKKSLQEEETRMKTRTRRG